MIALYIILGVALLGVMVLIGIYNGLITKRNMAQEGWSGIDVQLKRRSDLIPNLVDTVKGYAAHESGVFEKVTEMRAKTFGVSSTEDRAKAEGALTGALANLMAVAENYPDLKANQNFQELQKTLADTEDQIQMARRYYNGAVRDLNTGVQTFPGNIVAGMFHVEAMHFFELESPADRAVPKVSF